MTLRLKVLLPPEPDTEGPSAWTPIRIRQLMQFKVWTQQDLADAIGSGNRFAVHNWVRVKNPKPVSRHHRRVLDAIALETGFLEAERKAKRPLPYHGSKRQPKGWLKTKLIPGVPQDPQEGAS